MSLLLVVFGANGCGGRHSAIESDADADADAEGGRLDVGPDGADSSTTGDSGVDGGEADAWPGWDGGDAACAPWEDRVYRGDVVLRGRGHLWPLVGISRLEGSLTITASTLENLAGLECLEVVGVDLDIAGNHRLTTLSGLEALFFVGGRVTLGTLAEDGGNDGLESLEGLGALGSVGCLAIEGNSRLRSLDGLRHQRTEPGCRLVIRGNPSLEVPFFDDDAQLGAGLIADLVVESNASLRSLGYWFVEGVLYGDLVLRDLPALADISGIRGVSYIAGDLVVEATGLAGLGCLHGLGGLGGDRLVVVDNPSVPTCEAEALRDTLRRLGWEGEAEIHGNDDEGTCP
jgi:hypothetical protein